ncbi:CocE/NonD family hydrolase [Nocardia aobensis]|uniref:CocE/NonD family hydrolase n=1 Tax=Nocardia aobensis TaxID=257277 RepID=A0ABW6PFR4_9NOCA
MSHGHQRASVRLLAKLSAVCMVLSGTAALPVLAPPATADVGPGWRDYERPATYEPIETSIMVPVRDGTSIGCELYRPGRNGAVAPGRFPAVVWDFTPYTATHLPAVPGLDTATAGSSALAPLVGYAESGGKAAEYFAARGYAVARCHVRGTGNSGGDFPSWFQPIEAQDNYDLIEWLAAQPWSTGRVGQGGASYGSLTSQRVAALNPPHLEAIVPEVAPGSIYEWIYPGGIPSTSGATWATLAAAMSYGRVDPTRISQSFAAHPLYDDFWRQIDITDNLKDIHVPTLLFGGWQDLFTNGTVQDFQGRSSNAWLVMGAGQHGFAQDDPHSPVPLGAVLGWWDHWLMQLPSAPLPSSRVTTFELPTAGGGGWKELSAWPPSDVHSERMYLGADRSLSERPGPEGTTSYQVNPIDGPARSWLGNYIAYPESPAADQSSADRQRLTFTTGPLTDDAVVAGTARVHLRAALSAPNGYFVVKVEDVAPDGKVVGTTDGYLEASHRDGDDHEVTIAPGEFNDYTVAISPTHWRFAKGHQIRIAVTSGDLPVVPPDAPAGTATIANGPEGSWVDLPLR